MIKKYSDFKYFFLFESLLRIDKDLNLIVSDISSKDPIAKILVDLFDKDIKTNVNYLKHADKNDDVKFVNDTQVKRFLDAGQDPFDRATNSAKIGRTVRQILTANDISVTDQQIEKFVNAYKNAWDKKYNKNQEGFHLVAGDDIKNWYLESNYVPGGGTLNNSCMRYDSCQKYFEIYSQNPAVCQLLILLDDRNRLLGRAILWKLKPGTGRKDYYLDRIYTRFDNDVEKFAEWFKEFLKVDSESQDFNAHFLGNTRGLRVQLKNWKFKLFPYMDTFSVLDYDSGQLMTYDGVDSSKLQFHIQNTGGHPSVPSHEWSEAYQNWFHVDDCAWIEDKSDYYPKEDCMKDYKLNWILKSDSIYSEYYGNYIQKSTAVELENFGLVDSRDIVEVYDEVINGHLNKPKKFLRSKLSGSEYQKVEIGYSYKWVNKKYVFYDAVNHECVIQDDDFEEKYTKFYFLPQSPISTLEKYFSVVEIDRNYECYGISDEYTETPIISRLYSDLSNETAYYAIKEVIETFSLESSEKFVVVKKSDFFRAYKEMCYSRTLEILDNLKNIKSEPLRKILVIIDEDCTRRFNTYKQLNSNYEMMKDYGSYLNYFNSTISKKFKEEKVFEILEGQEVVNKFQSWIGENERSIDFIVNYRKSNQENYSIQRNQSDEEQKKLIRLFIETYKYQIIYFSYWLILMDDRSHADDKLTILNNKMKFDTNFKVNYFCRYDEISGEFAQTISDIRRDISNKFTYQPLLQEVGVSIYDENFDKIMNIYNDFLSKLNK
jgi:hypothetical protein